MSADKTMIVTDENGKDLFLRKWLPDGTPKAVLQIIHGMSEHSGRYSHVGKFFSSKGFVVVAHDHRGHGKTDPDQLGHLDHNHGFDVLAENIHDIKSSVSSEYPEAPYIMLGHSMGSFCLQRYFQLFNDDADAIIYSGSNGKPPLMLNVGIWLSAFQKVLFGDDAKSPLIDRLSFGSYNNYFKPNRTRADWLSSDEDMVDLYLDDPYCGFIFTNSFYYALFKGLKVMHAHKPFAGHDKSIPVLLLSGDKDPVSNMGRGVKNLEKILRRSGVKTVDVKLYENGRHEMLNETNREEVLNDLLSWIEDKVAESEQMG